MHLRIKVKIKKKLYNQLIGGHEALGICSGIFLVFIDDGFDIVAIRQNEVSIPYSIYNFIVGYSVVRISLCSRL